MASVLVRSLAGLALVAAIGGAFYVAFGEKPVLVDLASVTTAPMQVTVKEDGVTRIRNVYEVSSPHRRTSRPDRILGGRPDRRRREDCRKSTPWNHRSWM